MSEALSACPFCGGSDLEIRENGRTWRGSSWGEPASVSVWHHCEATPGQPSRGIERVGRDRASAIAAWNRRAPTSAAGATKPHELTSSPEPAPASPTMSKSMLKRMAHAPAPALRAAEWVDGTMKRITALRSMRAGVYVAALDDLRAHLSTAPGYELVIPDGNGFVAPQPTQEAMRKAQAGVYGVTHLAANQIDPAPSHASGLLPVAREGLSDEQIFAIAAVPRTNEPSRDGYVLPFARAIEAAHGIAPASGDAPGEAK